jgi:hypothetical protein
VGIQPLGQIVAKNLDTDELFYLKTMRRVIADCQLPYFQRAELWESIEAELEELRSSDQYPFVADQILLGDIEEDQRRQALDRARCEAWRLALCLACGRDTPRHVLNPLTGTPFQFQRNDESITVEAIDPEDEDSVITIRALHGSGGL